MTTAARPTWAPAKGGNEQGGTRIFGPSQKYSSRDIASHTTLKPRSIFYSFFWVFIEINFFIRFFFPFLVWRNYGIRDFFFFSLSVWLKTTVSIKD